jgi:hypothetical protein
MGKYLCQWPQGHASGVPRGGAAAIRLAHFRHSLSLSAWSETSGEVLDLAGSDAFVRALAIGSSEGAVREAGLWCS